MFVHVWHDAPLPGHDAAVPLCAVHCHIIYVSPTDLAEVCPGGSGECPMDTFFFPGTPCSTDTTSGTFSGRCFSGVCHSMEYTCTHYVGKTLNLTLDNGSETCRSMNDECSSFFSLACHVAGGDSTQCE